MKKHFRRPHRRFVAAAACATAAISTAALAGYAGPVVTPEDLDFGDVVVNTTSAPQSLSVAAAQGPQSTTGSDLEIVSIQFPPGYSRSGGTCPDTGQSPTNPCTIEVVFAPTALGPQPGTVEISAISFGVAGPGTTTVDVAGTGVPGGLPDATPVPMNDLWALLLLLGGLAGVGALAIARR